MVDVPYWWHATLFEVLWLVAGVASALLTAGNLRDTWKDREVLEMIRRDKSVHRLHFQMLRIVVLGRIESQVVRMAISLLIIVSGVTGVVTPNPLRGATTWTTFAVTLTILGIGMLTALKSFTDYRQREALYEMAQGRSAVIAAKLRAGAAEPEAEP